LVHSKIKDTLLPVPGKDRFDLAMEFAQGDLLQTSLDKLIIPADNVACVQEDNLAEHALLVLIKSGYSAIPVLNTTGFVTGIISKTMILDAILGLESIEFEKLTVMQVNEVMNRSVPRVQMTTSFLRLLELCIRSPFLCVESLEGSFMGLVTRQAILREIDKYLRSRQGKLDQI
jgi:predicted transcriptional regulator